MKRAAYNRTGLGLVHAFTKNVPNLFRDVKSLASVLVLPIASEGFSNYGVVWFLQALGLLVKAREVPFGDRLNPVEWAVVLGGPAAAQFDENRFEDTHKRKMCMKRAQIANCSLLTRKVCLRGSNSRRFYPKKTSARE